MLTAIFFKKFFSKEATEHSKLSELMTFGNGKSRPKTDGTIPVYGGNGVLSCTDQHNIENAIFAKSKVTKDEFFDYFLLRGLNLINHHVGTGQQLLTQEILNNIEIIRPDIEQIKLFNQRAKLGFETISANKNEIIRLQNLSDLLLSRLAG